MAEVNIETQTLPVWWAVGQPYDYGLMGTQGSQRSQRSFQVGIRRTVVDEVSCRSCSSVTCFIAAGGSKSSTFVGLDLPSCLALASRTGLILEAATWGAREKGSRGI